MGDFSTREAFINKWKKMMANATPKKGQSKDDFKDSKSLTTAAVKDYANDNLDDLTQEKLNDFYKDLTGKDYKDEKDVKQSADKKDSKSEVFGIAKLLDPQNVDPIFIAIQNRDTGSVFNEASKPNYDFEGPKAQVEYTKKKQGGRTVKKLVGGVDGEPEPAPAGVALNPLQFAVLNGDTASVRLLIQLGANYSVVTSRGETLAQLVNLRPNNDIYKSEIVQLLKDVKNAQDRAFDDYIGQRPPNDAYGKDLKLNAGVAGAVYKRKYAEAQTKTKAKTPVSNIIRSVEKEAKEDALAGARNEKYVPDPEGNRELQVNQQLVEAYNKAYDLQRAKMRSKADSERNQPPQFQPEPEEDTSSFSTPEQREAAYTKAYTKLDDRGFEDGIIGKQKTQKYSSSAFGLGPELSQVIGLVVSEPEESKQYDAGYEEGVRIFLSKIDTLISQAKRNGFADGKENKKFNRSGEITYEKEDGSKQVYTFAYDKIDRNVTYGKSNPKQTELSNLKKKQKELYDQGVKDDYKSSSEGKVLTKLKEELAEKDKKVEKSKDEIYEVVKLKEQIAKKEQEETARGYDRDYRVDRLNALQKEIETLEKETSGEDTQGKRYPFNEVYQAYLSGYKKGQESRISQATRGGKTYRKKKDSKKTKSRTYKKKLARK